MARKKINSMITLHNWDDVDDTLRQIGEHVRDIRAIENVMNEQIATAKAAAVDRSRPLKEQVAALELALQEFALAHRGDMDGRKSKQLPYGTVGFRRSTKIALPSAKEKVAAIVARLRTRGMDECINQPEAKVDKEALKKYGADVVAEVGATLTVTDVFGYEINEERLRE